MNQQETIALFERCEAARAAVRELGKDDDAAHDAARAVWNAWAEGMLSTRKALEEAGDWVEAAAADFRPLRFDVAGRDLCRTGEASDADDPAEPMTEGILVEGGQIRFDGFIFPGAARFGGTQFCGDAVFTEARFLDEAQFEAARFLGQASFVMTQFSGEAWFGEAQFREDARFTRAQFSGRADFANALFSEEAKFGKAQFSSDAGFWRARFSYAAFDNAQFSEDANFDEAEFARAWFYEAQFSGRAEFRASRFAGEARFDRVQFLDDAIFTEARFSAETCFVEAQFSDGALFEKAQFLGPAQFGEAQFGDDAWFVEARFSGVAEFKETKFGCGAHFRMAEFDKLATFEKARFRCCAKFGAILCERGFSLAGAEFDRVPDFIQAHFEEAPWLADMRVHHRMIDRLPEAGPKFLPLSPTVSYEEPDDDVPPPPRAWEQGRAALKSTLVRWRSFPLRAGKGVWRRIRRADCDVPACFRALRRLAALGCDPAREREFFAREIRSARFASDWPAPWPIWRREAWAGAGRFWLGLGYDIFGGLGVSTLRPLAWWVMIMFAASAFFVSANPDVTRQRETLQGQGASALSAYAQTALAAVRTPQACFAPPPKDGAAPYVGGLSADVRATTNAGAEALSLAFRNAFVMLDVGGEAAHRSYGCLYGVELYGAGAPVAVAPGGVSIVSTLQKAVSALLLFLFGLALKNKLRSR